MKTVIIEIQKTKFPTDNLRFRKYLGSQYADNQNAHKVLTGGRLRTTGIPIISIYFLGHKLDRVTACAIGVKRAYVDLITNEPIQQKEVFIESLTHDSYIIQIPFLTPQRRNDLEILLSVFDQSKAIDARRHILNITEEEFPEKFRPIIRKLQKAIQSKQVKQKMDMEDTLIDELTEMELTIRKLEVENKQSQLIIEQERREKEQERQQKEQERQQKEQERQQKEQERQQKEQERREKEQERREKEAALLKERLAQEEIEQLKQQIAQLLKDKKD